MKQEKWWAIVIVALVAVSLWICGAFGPNKHFPVRYGLDIEGGARAVLRADTSKLPAGQDWETTAPLVQQTIEKRINASGVSEATVQRKGIDQFIVELPQVQNKNEVLARLGTTAQMTFYYFADVASTDNDTNIDPSFRNRPLEIQIGRDSKGREKSLFTVRQPWQGFTPGFAFGDGAQTRAAWADLLAQAKNTQPGGKNTPYIAPPNGLNTDQTVYLTPEQRQQADLLNRQLAAWNALLQTSLAANGGQPVLKGDDIEPHSQAETGGGGLVPEPVVTQTFTADGARKYAEFTERHVGAMVGIVLDDQAISVPFIGGPITGGQGQISGGFKTLEEAKDLASLLNAGALPVPLEQVQVETVEASLGKGAVEKSIHAGLLGLALVLVFMIGYYRLPGFIASVALLIYALFTLAIFRGGLQWLFPGFAVTLTLPGIAGFILSIGMAVDANILIFERLKEELRNGKALRSAIDAGFSRAFTAIRDSNICTTITCLVLYTLGTASVRGFALTLLIGVLVSLFSAITVTRTFLYLLVDAGIGNNPVLFGLNTRSLVGQTTSDATHKGWNIIGRRKTFYALSLLIIVPGLIFWLGLKPSGLKKSIEFTGGTQIEVKYPQAVTQEAVASALTKTGFKDPHVQMAEGGTIAIVSVKDTSRVANPAQNPVHQQLIQALNTLGTPQEESFGNVGGIISKELTSRAIQAVFLASFLIVLYLAMVFSIGGFVAGLRLGLSAIIALLHDVLVLIGLFAILGHFLGWEIDSLFVTALLTVIGFSVHDTVVIFDRVRENLRHKARGETFETLVNKSVQQSLARSINTSLTVIMTLLALVLVGGQSTRLLNVALLIGILSGTYSSIFNAASILVDWENWLARRSPAPALAEGQAAQDEPGAAPGDPAEPRVATARPRTKRPVRRF